MSRSRLSGPADSVVISDVRTWTRLTLGLILGIITGCGADIDLPNLPEDAGEEADLVKEYEHAVGYWVPQNEDEDAAADMLADATISVGVSAFEKFVLNLPGPWSIVTTVIGQIPSVGNRPTIEYYVKTEDSLEWSRFVSICPEDSVLVMLRYLPGDEMIHANGFTINIEKRGIFDWTTIGTITLLEPNEEQSGSPPNFIVLKEPLFFGEFIDPDPIGSSEKYRIQGATINVDLAGEGCDDCPNDPNKTSPGVCGCGLADTDADSDGTPDCNDGCPSDPDKTSPGNCGCGEPETPGCGGDGDNYVDTVIDTVPLGEYVTHLALSPDGQYLYASDDYVTVYVIRTIDNAVVDTVTVGDNPRELAVSLDGNYVYVANGWDGTVSVIDATSNTVVETISVGGGPFAIAAGRNGNYVYVTDKPGGSLSVISTAQWTITDSIAVGNEPEAMAVSPDGNYVYVANRQDGTVSVIELLSNSVTHTISVGSGGPTGPEALVVSPDSLYLYVGNSHDDTLEVVDIGQKRVVDTIPLSDSPAAVGVSPSGEYLYLTTWRESRVVIIRTQDNSIIDSIPVAADTFGLVVSPDGDYVYVATEYGISVLGRNN